GCSGSTRAATRPGPCSAAAEDGGEPLLPAGALDHDLDAVARLVAAHRLADVRGGADAAAVDADDDVAGLHAGQVRAAARLHPLHEGTCRGGDPEAVDDRAVHHRHVEGLHAQHRPRVADLAPGPQVVDDR